MEKATCYATQKEYNVDELMHYDNIRPAILREIKLDYPGFNEDSYINTELFAKYRERYIEKLVKTEIGEVTELERQVLDALRKNKLVSDNIEPDIEQQLTFGERLSDKIAEFGGSWRFIILFGIILVFWLILNSFILGNKSFDPYPYILLNLVLSCVAAMQAPVIMMSQNRQEDKDRTRSEHDYQVNLTAELQIRLLHEKVDHIMIDQFRNILEIQEIQLKTLEELGKKFKSPTDNHSLDNTES
jgi:uncharacterized membrane protein